MLILFSNKSRKQTELDEEERKLRKTELKRNKNNKIPINSNNNSFGHNYLPDETF